MFSHINEFIFQGTIYLRYLQLHSRKRKRRPDAGLWSGEVRYSYPQGQEDLHDPPQDHVSDTNLEKEIEEGEHCMIFLCGDKTTVPHQIGFQR